MDTDCSARAVVIFKVEGCFQTAGRLGATQISETVQNALDKSKSAASLSMTKSISYDVKRMSLTMIIRVEITTEISFSKRF